MRKDISRRQESLAFRKVNFQKSLNEKEDVRDYPRALHHFHRKDTDLYMASTDELLSILEDEQKKVTHGDEEPNDEGGVALPDDISEGAKKILESRAKLPDHMKFLYAQMMKFFHDYSWVTKPSSAMRALEGKNLAVVLVMMTAKPGYTVEESINRFYDQLAMFIHLMDEIDTAALIKRLGEFGLFDIKKFNELKKKIDKLNKTTRNRKE